jgi:hypothetical protein
MLIQVRSHKRKGRIVRAHTRKNLKVEKSLDDVSRAKLEAKLAQEKEKRLKAKLEELTKKYDKK